MAEFTEAIDVEAPAEVVWQAITDWPAHARWIPLTTVWVTTERPDGVGACFVGRTGVGPLAFDDPMEVVDWVAPAPGVSGYCRVRKHGRVVLGWADFAVEARVGGGSTVRWTESVQVAPVRLTRPLDRLIEFGGRLGFRRALRAMAREIEAEVRPGG